MFDDIFFMTAFLLLKKLLLMSSSLSLKNNIIVISITIFYFCNYYYLYYCHLNSWFIHVIKIIILTIRFLVNGFIQKVNSNILLTGQMLHIIIKILMTENSPTNK